MPRASSDHPGRHPYSPPPQEVERLIEEARRHPLGTEFLARGSLDAVAATFQVHAFTVEEARLRLQK